MPSHRFNKKQRLLSASDYKEVFDLNNVKISNSSLLILAKPSSGDQSRLGLVIAKKNIPTAVQRNRVKRVVRETFRHQEFTVAMDIVFLARNRANQLSTQQLTQLLNSAWLDLEAKCIPLRLNHA